VGAAGESGVVADWRGRMRWIGWRIGEREDDVVAGVDGALASGGAGEWGSVARRERRGRSELGPESAYTRELLAAVPEIPRIVQV